MKKNLIILLGICLVVFNLQSQTWAWGRAPLGSGNTECVAIAADPSGNSFITGYIISGSLAFGSTTLTNSGQKTFLAKYDPTGNALWARSTGGNNNSEIGWAVAADAFGNSFVTGFFGPGTISFGSITFTNTNVSNALDAFLVKYDPNGNVLWARQVAGTGSEIGRGVCTDASGNVIITGNFNSSSLTIGTYTLTNSAIGTVFIIKYDANGNVLWAKQNTSGGSDVGFSVSTDPTGNVFVTGSFDGFTSTFGTFTITNLNTVSPTEDMFIAKYSPTGTELWAKNSTSSTQHDRAYSVDADVAGNSYVTGYYGGFTSSMNCSGFLSKYDVNGNLLWSRFTSVGFGGPYGNIGYSLKTITNGVWVGGAMSGSSITLGTTTLSVPVYIDPVYLAHYDPNGNLIYAKATESGGDDNFGVTADNNCNLLYASDFMSSVYILDNDSLQNTGGESIFLAKLNYSCQGPLGVNYLVSNENKFLVYPNPTKSKLFVRYEDVEGSEVKIINILGQIILEQAFTEWVDVSNLSPGCYTIKIGVHNSKFIKE